MPDIKSPLLINRHLGMKSNDPAESIPDYYYANLINIDTSSVGALSSDNGYTKFGNTAQTATNVTACPRETYRLNDASTVRLKVIDNGTNTIILWLNTQNTTNDDDGEWEQLIGGLTTGVITSFAPYNTTSTNRLIMSNGTDAMMIFNGATTYLTADLTGAEATISVADTTNFASSGSIIIGGTTVTYSGKTSTTFTGCSGTPSASTNDGVAQAVDTSTLSAAPKLKNIKTLDARIVGSIGTRLYGSATGDATDWTVPDPVTLSSPFIRDFPEGSGDIKSIEKLGERWVIGKPGRQLAYKITFTATTLDPQEIIDEIDGDFGPASDNYVKIDSNTLAYVTEDGQIRLVQLNQQNDRLTGVPISEDVKPTLKNGIFTTTSGTYWRKERMLLYNFKTNSNSTQNDKIIKIQFVTDSLSGQPARPIISIKNWAMNCFTLDGKDLLGHDAYSIESYKLFDGYTLNGAPYNCIATSKRYPLNNSLKEAQILYLPIVGYIAAGGVLKFQLDYDNEGSRVHLESVFDSMNETDYIIQTDVKTIGAFELGSEPIGGNVDSISELNFFRIFFELPPNHKPYDVQLTIYSDGVSSDNATVVGNRWSVLYYAFDRRDAETRVDKKLKKEFNIS